SHSPSRTARRRTERLAQQTLLLGSLNGSLRLGHVRAFQRVTAGSPTVRTHTPRSPALLLQDIQRRLSVLHRVEQILLRRDDPGLQQLLVPRRVDLPQATVAREAGRVRVGAVRGRLVSGLSLSDRNKTDEGVACGASLRCDLGYLLWGQRCHRLDPHHVFSATTCAAWARRPSHVLLSHASFVPIAAPTAV